MDLSTPPKSDETMKDNIDVYVDMIMTSLPVSTATAEKIRDETAKNPVLTKFTKTILEGWPEQRNQCSPESKDFWNYNDEFPKVDGLVLKGNRIVIPKSLQGHMLQQLHKGHMGMEKCKCCAREVIFWPGLNADIDKFLEKCTTCISNRRKEQAELMKAHETPEIPWEKASWNGPLHCQWY